MVTKIKQKAYLILITAGVIICLFGVLFITIPNHQAKQASTAFIRALASGDDVTPYCAGEVLYRIKTRETNKAQVIGTWAQIIDRKNVFARSYVAVELMLSDKTADAGFYELDVIKTETGWKVINARETMPRPIGISRPWQKNNLAKQYQLLFSNPRQVVAGPARTAFEKTPTPKINDVPQGITTKIIFNGSNVVVAKHSYVFQKRKVNTLAHYYKTTQGWKIVAVQAL